LGWLAGDFMGPTVDRPLNILIWGPMGAGKTCFINGLLGLFSSELLVNRRLIAYRSSEHVTRSYSMNALKDHISQDTRLGEVLSQNLHLNFWDSWGLTATNYQKLNVLQFLEGRVHPGTQFNDSSCNEPVLKENVIHAVILLIPIGSSQDPDLLQTLSLNIQTILQFGIFPVVVINFRNHVDSKEELEKAFNQILEASHLNRPDLFLMDNYEHEEYRNMETDLMYWRILTKVFKTGMKNRTKPSSVTRPPSASGRVCLTTTCNNFRVQIQFPFCPLCGKKTTTPSQNKGCTFSDCEMFGQPLDLNFLFCPGCGNAVGSQ